MKAKTDEPLPRLISIGDKYSPAMEIKDQAEGSERNHNQALPMNCQKWTARTL